ncbi:MAG TPA: Ig-like domain-containing protein [Solirubrobacterales bacterium]|nr:Ig-like domain-containing protein [Solirubrobacterales bacterium]
MSTSNLFRGSSRNQRIFGGLIAMLLALAVPALAFAAFKDSTSTPNSGPISGGTCLGLEVTLPGTAGDDLLRGTPGNNVIDGFGGNDRIIGGGGIDVVCGGPGNDYVTTGKGPDKIAGESGNDKINARRGPDLVYGQGGNDLLIGGPGFDRISGGSGHDTEWGKEKKAPPLGHDKTASGRGGCDKGKEKDNGECKGKNQPPGAVGDKATTDEDTAKAIDVLANDSDPDGDALTVVSLDTTGTRGAVTITGGGSGVEFDPRGRFDELQVGESAEDSFAYTISDGHEHTSTATVAVTVTGVDDPPKAVKDSVKLKENASSAHVDVLANDTDVDGGPKEVKSVTNGAHGTVTISSEGKGVDYHPEANYCGSDSFTYTLNGGSTATVAVEIECIDDAPVAVNDSATVQEDSGANSIDVLANDTDSDGGPKEVKSVTQPANGTVAITGGGSGVSYTPDANYCNEPPGTTPDTFEYTLNPGTETSATTATVTVKVNCVDDPPVAVNDTKTVEEDSGATEINVLSNDTDIDGGPKEVKSVTQPANGTVVITGGGTGLTYKPNANYCNEPPGTTPDAFEYTLNGGSKGTVSVKVTCVDDAPVAVNDTKTVKEDSGATAINVLSNDTDVDGGAKKIESVTQPANGTVAITGGGSELTYEPDANYCNEPPGTTPDTFEYTLNGGSKATVSVKVECLDDAPVAVNDTETVKEDSGATAINVLGNDTDVDGGPKEVKSVTQPANGTVVITGGGSELTYEPDANYCDEEEPDTFTYALNGGSEATVSVKVTCVDDAPVAVNDTKTVKEDSGATEVNVLGNDTDVDGGPKSIESVTQPTNGTVVITGGGTGLTYEPDANYCNEPPGTTPDTFEYELNGGSKATVSVKVECVDDAPVAVNDTKTVKEDSGASSINVLGNDTDIDGGPKEVKSVTQPTNGTVVITGGGSELTYEPDANYCNEPPGTTPDTFEYELNGGSKATVSVKVECVDDPPTAVNDTETVEEDSGATAINVLANDTDPDGGTKSIESVTQPANGAVVITGGGTGLTYEPDANYCNEPPGTEPDSFEYTLNGGSSATVAVTVECVDDPPTAVNDSATVLEDSGATEINVLANDTDPDGGTKSIESVTQPANGAVVITGGGTGLTYKPGANYCNEPPGTTPDTFTYEITGGSKATVSVKVECVNDPPTDLALSSSKVKENEPAGTTVGTFSTTDPDVGDTFTYSLVSGEGSTDNGSFEISGNQLKTKESFNFEAKSSYSIRVKTTDSGGESVEKQLTITVENVNDPPTNLALSKSEINENEPAGTEIGTFSTTDEDVGDTFTYSLVTGEGSTDNGSFEISGNKLKAKESFNFEAKSSYSIRVRTTDSGGKTFEKKLTITIIDVNDPPKTVADSYSGAVGNTTAVLGNVVSGPNVTLSGMSGNVPSANDTDEDAGDTLSVVPETVSTTGGGSVTIDSDGTFTYTPGVGDKNQTDEFTYKVTDGEATSTGKVSIGIENTLVWYVNGSAASEGDGRSATPYKTLAGINGAGGSGDADGSADYLFLYGSNTYSGGLPLETNQKLVGSPEGLSVPNHPNLVAATGTNPVVTNASGNAIALANGSEVLRVNATGASGVGISGTSVTTATVGPNTTISGNSGGGVSLSGAAGGEISIGSTIENETGSVVSVSNRSSGTVTLSGNITSSNGGVSATSNTGAHVAYTGALNLTRTSGEAFVATGGGGVKATNSGNKATTTSATAVRVANTTIDSGGVNFQSVNSTGATNGIVLESTGSTAGLTIIGTGSAGTGGTITTSTGPGILLSNTSNVSLASVKVTNGGDDGIRGSNVNGFSLTGSSQVTGNGNAVTEDGLDFTNLTGTVNLTNATVSASAERNVSVVNESGTVNATFSGGTYSNTNNSAVGGDAIFFEGTNTGTIGVAVENATFTNNRDDHVQVTTDAANTVTENVTVKGNTMSNTIGEPGGAVTLNPGGEATMHGSVLNNTITGAHIEGITVDTPGSQISPQPAQVNVTISGNTIGNPAIASSGSSTGNDVGVRSNGAATVKALITNNNLYQYRNLVGLFLDQNEGSGTLDATVRGNTISNPAANEELLGMRIVIGSLTNDKGTSCLDIGGATSELKNNLTGSANPETPDSRFVMNGEATAQLAGYTGGAHEASAVETYLTGRNIAPDGMRASQNAKSSYAQTTSCPLPE